MIYKFINMRIYGFYTIERRHILHFYGSFLKTVMRIITSMSKSRMASIA